jgi:hypothetical protein
MYDDYTTIVGATEVDEGNGEHLFIAIEGERVDIPLWFINGRDDGNNIGKYTGNDTLYVEIMIFPHETLADSDGLHLLGWADFEAVVFAKNRATKSWNDAVASSS